jgi:F-type H+-transporting ATPase subunit gamma
MKVYHAILELVASEQSARMVAMRNASDNAKELIEDLTLALHKVRQEIITKEICDISGGAEALV